MTILAPILALAFLGLLAGLILGFAHQKFAVVEDPRVKKVMSLLPGANCGACGYAGCHGFAEAVVAGIIEPAGCLLGGDKTAKEVSEALGLEGTTRVATAAYLLCGGGHTNSQEKFEYQGVKTCRAADTAGGGFKACAYGCLTLGDCVPVCPVDAITMSQDGLPIVDVNKCIGCGKCVKACPRDLYVLLPKKTKYFVKCASKDKGAVVRKVCKVGCIACTLCVKACKFEAIKIENNLAIIDQSKCTNCGDCIKVCPTKCIVEFVV